MNEPRPPRPAPVRWHLPDTRPSLTEKVAAMGHEMYVTVGFFDGDGYSAEEACAPAEVFITVSKYGSDLAGWMNALAAVLSKSLQYGCPWEVYREAMLHTFYGGSKDEKGHTSMVDALAKAVDRLVARRKAMVLE